MQVSVTTKRYLCISIIGVFLTFFFVLTGTSFADRGGWYLSTEPVTLNESGQRAIIGWDGQTQVLCLGTDVSSSKKTTVIEFLPLPSEPNVSLGNREAFEAVEEVLAENFVRFVKKERWLGLIKRLSEDGGEPFRITFHQRLGAHDITVVKVNRPDEFADWVQEKAKALTGAQTSLPDSIRELIAKYLNEYNCPYFVFDVIEVGPDPQSVEPIIYEFKCPVVFYPLEISSTFHGDTTIDLIIFSKEHINPDPFWRLGFQVSSVGGVNPPDMQRVMPRLEELLDERSYLQAFRYSGSIRKLRGNITVGLRRDNLSYTADEYSRDRSRSFYVGLALGITGGIIIAFVSLWPLYFAAKRQRPRWGLRLLAGFLLGIPLAIVLVSGVFHLWSLGLLGQFQQIEETIIFIMCSMGMGFIIFCFQLGLRRHWYLWGLLYAALAVFVTFVSDFELLEHVFSGHWYGSWERICPVFVAYFLVFVLLFIIARFLVWITSPRKRRRSPLNR